VPVLAADRPPAPDLAAIRDLIAGETLERACDLQLE
jgi:hypothetical protein